MTDIRIINAEALKIGPDEVLILHLKDQPVDFDDPEGTDFAQSVADELERIGLKDRALVIFGDVEFAVAPADKAKP